MSNVAVLVAERVKSGKRVIDMIDHSKYSEYERSVMDAAAILYHKNILSYGHHREYIADMVSSEWFNKWTHNQIAHTNNILLSDRYAEYITKLGVNIAKMEKDKNTVSYDAKNDAIVVLIVNANGRKTVIDWQEYYSDIKNPNRFLIPVAMVGNPDQLIKHFKDAGFAFDDKASALFATMQSDVLIEDEEVVIKITMPDDIRKAISELWDVEEADNGDMRVALTPELMELLNAAKNGIRFTPDQLERMERWNIENAAVQDELRAKAAEAMAYLDTCGDWRNPRIMNNQGVYAPTPLRDFQVTAIERITGKGFFLFAAGTGAGKTITAYIAAMGIRRGHKIPLIIICPKSVVNGWRDTINELRKQFKMWPTPVKIFTWDGLPEVGGYSLLDDYDGAVIIADEIHNIKNMQSRRFKRAAAFMRHKNVSGVIALTGTPVPNGRATEIFPILHILNHPLASMGRDEFIKKYSTTKKLPKLRAAWADAVYYVDKSKVNLPPVVNNFVRVPMTQENARKYDEYLQPKIADYEAAIENGTRSKKSAAMFLVNSARHASSEAKIQEAIDLARDMHEEGSAAIIFTEFRNTVDAVYEGIRKFTSKVVTITGDSSKSERSRAIEGNKSGEIDFIVATTATLGEGINGLQFRTHNMIFVDFAWSVGRVDQAIARLQRGGQKEITNVYWLEFSPLDVAIARLVTRKMERVMLMGFADKSIVSRNNGAELDNEEDELEILGDMAAKGLEFDEQ